MRYGNVMFDRELAMMWGQKIVIAIAILVVTWLLAKAAKWAFAKLVDRVKWLQRGTADGTSVGESLGKIASLLIWLFGLVALLQVFALDGVITPLNTLLNQVMQFLPNLIGAGLVFFVGSLIARIVKELIETALMTVDFDKWANRGGASEVTGNATISKTIATIVYALIMILVAIAALQILQISVISDPAERMLTMIFDAIPRVIGAALVLGIGYLIARFAGQLLREILVGMGVDRSLAGMGILPATASASAVIVTIAQIAIMIAFAIMATRMLGFPEITAILDEVLQLGGKVIFGGVIIAVGFLIAGMLARIIAGTGESGLAPTIVRYATIVLFTAMGLKQMGIADSIIEMAFGALVIGTAVAGALAFGLGGREAAARTLDDMRAEAKRQDATPPPPPPPTL